ncbi:ubiquitin recognition factor in ER-associated degradation protein 1-like [Corticium candelabrum]|uniref:ubiquitin recognition factor in ER-associated degradation protein 1-like n=1 Tax=Corticium candelabrum TaxID=121492 RepID=UPI002E275455|nr:ubiquitin recognition factor in ER-associated degradation protein 1-like [Corticium candelabrum]
MAVFGGFGLFGDGVPEGFPRPGGGVFRQTYRAFSVLLLPGAERQDVERGGKIIMPPSALDQLTRLNIVYPMLFKLVNEKSNRVTHCGVLEFVADEGRIYLPYWMMRNLLLEQGDLIQLESTALPVATFSKFQPQQTEFLDITNPKAVLENALRSFACLTKNDLLAIQYNNKTYELMVMEVKPRDAVSIIECDMNVDFAPPVGYKEPEYVKPKPITNDVVADGVAVVDDQFRAFTGAGQRLDGKKPKRLPAVASVSTSGPRRGIPNYDYKKGKLTFPKAASISKVEEQGESAECSTFEPFCGQGATIRQKKKH